MSLSKWVFRKELWQKGWDYLKDKGPKQALNRFFVLVREKIWEISFLQVENEERYKKWWQSQELDPGEIENLKRKIEKFQYKPIISVLVPVYNTPPKWLNECFKSVTNQIYPYLELCISDDASSSLKTKEILKKWEKRSKKDKRIKIHYQKENLHISRATNKCLKLATGEFVALLDHDDTLHPAALYLAVKKLNEDPNLDFIYTDEDKLDRRGNHCDPYFKSDWNPDLLLSVNYICHLSIIRRNLMEDLGGMRRGYEGSQDYDLFLRLTEKTDKIAHIPHILYHWRKVKGSTSFSYQSKSYAGKASTLALEDAMKRRFPLSNINVEKSLATCSFHIRKPIKKKKNVTIIIPFKDKVELLKRCVESIFDKTDYPHYRIFLVDNNSKEPGTLKYLEKINKNARVKVLRYPYPFNFSAINNWAARKTDDPYILFLNNDISVVSQDWLSSMVSHIERNEVGAVGAKLLYPNGKIQHAGVVLGIGHFKDKKTGIAGHAFKYFPKGSHGYFEQIDVIRDVSAVTAACMLTKRDIFLGLGGFNEKDLKIAWNDVDYCLRLRQKGYLIVYTPYAKLYHFESISRGSDEKGEKLKRFHRECEYMYEKWGDVLGHDPYYNPNLSLEDESYRIKSKIPSSNPLK